jgi:hypothetical protein
MFTPVNISMVVLTIVILSGLTIMFAIRRQNRCFCTRCTKTMPKAKLVKFMGKFDMCEPCENIASYYNQQQ